MTKSQIEITDQRLRFEEIYARNNPKRKFNRSPDGYHQPHAHLCYFYWLAAKQDAEIQNAKVGDIIETPSGLFQVMKHPDSVDDSGITTDGLIHSYCAYCGTESYEHLPNCKGARG